MTTQIDSGSGRGGRFLGVAGRWSNSMAALAVPPRCVACGGGTLPEARVCDRCRWEIERLPAGTLAPETRTRFGDCFAAYPYEGPVRNLVQALKFRGAVAAAREIAGLIVERVPVGLLAGAVLVPVPAHPARRRSRGFNQAALLAHEIAAICELSVLDILVRDRTRPPQATLSRAERLTLPKQSVRVEYAGRAVEKHARNAIPLGVFPTKVVLVDDVATTGVTLEVCASAIREGYPTGKAQFREQPGHRQQIQGVAIGALAFASTSAHPAQTKGSHYKG